MPSVNTCQFRQMEDFIFSRQRAAHLSETYPVDGEWVVPAAKEEMSTPSEVSSNKIVHKPSSGDNFLALVRNPDWSSDQACRAYSHASKKLPLNNLDDSMPSASSFQSSNEIFYSCDSFLSELSSEAYFADDERSADSEREEKSTKYVTQIGKTVCKPSSGNSIVPELHNPDKSSGQVCCAPVLMDELKQQPSTDNPIVPYDGIMHLDTTHPFIDAYGIKSIVRVLSIDHNSQVSRAYQQGLHAEALGSHQVLSLGQDFSSQHKNASKHRATSGKPGHTLATKRGPASFQRADPQFTKASLPSPRNTLDKGDLSNVHYRSADYFTQISRDYQQRLRTEASGSQQVSNLAHGSTSRKHTNAPKHRAPVGKSDMTILLKGGNSSFQYLGSSEPSCPSLRVSPSDLSGFNLRVAQQSKIMDSDTIKQAYQQRPHTENLGFQQALNLTQPPDAVVHDFAKRHRANASELRQTLALNRRLSQFKGIESCQVTSISLQSPCSDSEIHDLSKPRQADSANSLKSASSDSYTDATDSSSIIFIY